jgi:hypothetical protein
LGAQWMGLEVHATHAAARRLSYPDDRASG